MTLRQSYLSPRIALLPAIVMTAVAFIGSILWTVYLSFTASRRFPDYVFVGWKQYIRLFNDDNWLVALQNMLLFGLGNLASIVIGFVLAALIDKEQRGAAVFRTIFLYPLSISLIVTGITWRWLFDPSLGVESFFHSIGWSWVHFRWLSFGRHSDVGHQSRVGLAEHGIIHGAACRGAEGHQSRNLERGAH